MTAPYTIDAIDHVVIRVRDMDAMLRFYCDVLGCRLAKVNTPLGLYHLRAGLSMIDLIDAEGELGRAGGALPPGPDTGGRNVDHMALRITPFDETTIREHLAAEGVAASDAGVRFGAGGDGLSLYVTDPEGNVVELKAG
jgi:glyoxylase I family protein